MEILSVILYVLGSILLVVLIILGIKMIKTMNKIDIVVNDINAKMGSLNGFFSMIDFTTDKLALISDRFVDAVSSLIRKLFKRDKKEEEESEDE